MLPQDIQFSNFGRNINPLSWCVRNTHVGGDVCVCLGVGRRGRGQYVSEFNGFESETRPLFVLRDLHWLPMKERIIHKTMSQAYNCFNDTAPQYVQGLIHHNITSRSLRAYYQSYHRIPNVDRIHTTKLFGFRAFSNSDPWLQCSPSDNDRNLSLLQLFEHNSRCALFLNRCPVLSSVQVSHLSSVFYFYFWLYKQTDFPGLFVCFIA